MKTRTVKRILSTFMAVAISGAMMGAVPAVAQNAPDVSAEIAVLSAKYDESSNFAKLESWFEEHNADEEQIRLILSDEEMMEDILRDRFWEDNDNQAVTLAARSTSYPIAGYGNGTYFSKNRKACTHHRNSVASCSLDGSCGCQSFDSSIQCNGFAKLVYWTSTGNHIGNNSLGLGMSGTWNTTNIKNYFTNKVDVGSYVRLTTKSGLGHSIIVTNITSSGITLYDCNYDMQCGVRIKTYTWNSIYNSFSAINGVYKYSN